MHNKTFEVLNAQHMGLLADRLAHKYQTTHNFKQAMNLAGTEFKHNGKTETFYGLCADAHNLYTLMIEYK